MKKVKIFLLLGFSIQTHILRQATNIIIISVVVQLESMGVRRMCNSLTEDQQKLLLENLAELHLSEPLAFIMHPAPVFSS